MQALPLAYRQVHLDFHTSEQIPGIGSRFDAAQFVATLQRAEVNSITCFSKCHHGMIYHDTRFAARHPHLEVNLLREQIEACHAAGIRVPIYISVGLDEFMAARHPEWVELGVDGKRRGAAPLQAGWKKLCFNTPYMDYVWEQTQEVLELFEVDGLFFDIINQGQCCCRWCMARMAEEGVNPESEPERKQFARRILDEMKLDFTARIRERNAGCNVFWNSGHVDPSFRPVLGAYSHLELESLPSGGWGYDHFLLTVRYARNLGLDHVGMTGKFHKTWAGFGEFKNQAALEYECFTALAEGSKCSIGDQLPPSGELDPGTYELIGKVYSQVSRVEAWCEGAVPVTELAIFNPEALGVHDGRVDTAAGGAYRMLLEGHHQFDVVDGDMDWSRYRVLILPDKIRLDAVLLAKVRAYLAAGGKVVASHRAGMAPDRDEFVLTELGVRYLQESRFSPDYL
ncbi:MAG: beta-galactosidase, partial [Armatimonadetes bacterium]|nr:beta-galactosidase [Armatimonadota bacterium]